MDSDEIDALNEAQSFFDQQDSQENQQLEGAKRWVDEMMSNYQNGDTGMYDQMKSTMESLGIDEERLKNMSNEEVDQYVKEMCKKFGISQSLFDKLKDFMMMILKKLIFIKKRALNLCLLQVEI